MKSEPEFQVQVLLINDPDTPLGPFGKVETWGMSDHGLPELEMRQVRLSLLPSAGKMVERIAEYILRERCEVQPGQTFMLGPECILRVQKEEGPQGDLWLLEEAPDIFCPLCEGANYELPGARGRAGDE